MTKDEARDRALYAIEQIEGYARLKVSGFANYLEDAGFFTAPASARHHLACEGGLVIHSVNVMTTLLRLVNLNVSDEMIPGDAILISGLFHDLCKIDIYKEGGDPPSASQVNYLRSLILKLPFPFKAHFDEAGYTLENISKEQASQLIEWAKAPDAKAFPEKTVSYRYDDDFPIGHGEKSVILLKGWIDLTPSEALAIRWHMGAWEPGVTQDPRAFNAASASSKLVPFLQLADYYATMILEGED